MADNENAHVTAYTLRRELEALEKVWAVRNAETDKAIQLIQARVDKEPTPVEINADVKALRDLTAQSRDAAKEAIAKTESAVKDQLTNLGRQLEREAGSLKERLSEQNDRMIRIEQARRTETDVRGDTRNQIVLAILFAGLLISIGTALGLWSTRTTQVSPPQQIVIEQRDSRAQSIPPTPQP